jgi:hypothetical protein
MLTLIKALSTLLNDKASHFKKGRETDACDFGPFILVDH